MIEGGREEVGAGGDAYRTPVKAGSARSSAAAAALQSPSSSFHTPPSSVRSPASAERSGSSAPSPGCIQCENRRYDCAAVLQPVSSTRPSLRGCVLLSPAVFAALRLSLQQPVLLVCATQEDSSSSSNSSSAFRAALCNACPEQQPNSGGVVTAFPLVHFSVPASALPPAQTVSAGSVQQPSRLSIPLLAPSSLSSDAAALPLGFLSVALFPCLSPAPSSSLSAHALRPHVAHRVELSVRRRVDKQTQQTQAEGEVSRLKSELSVLLRDRHVVVGAVVHCEQRPELTLTVEQCLPAASKYPLVVTVSTSFSLLPAVPAAAAPADESSSASLVPPSSPAQLSLLSMILLPLRHPDLFARLGLDAPRGLLLHGQPGVGKTHAVRTVCSQLHVRLLVLNGSDLWSEYAGDAEERLRSLFATATASAEQQPTVLFIDELDVLCPQRSSSASSPLSSSSSLSTDRLTGQLLSLMDGVVPRGRLLVVAATNHPQAVDAALRRPGRFDRELEMQPPLQPERLGILRHYTQSLQLDAAVDLDRVAARCIGYVGADLEAVCREAGLSAMRRWRAEGGGRELRVSDFEAAMTRVPASSQRNALSYLPSSASHFSFSQLAGLSNVIARLQQTILWPLRFPTAYARLNLRVPRGVLLHGQPGVGKTSLVRAIAHEAAYALLTLDVSSVYSSYVGEAERIIREAFAQCRRNSPCILFIDEIDAIVVAREAASTDSSSSSHRDGGSIESRILSTLLNEMDGITSAASTLVIAATNRPQALDPALLRPGRFDHIIAVPLPDAGGRRDILRLLLSRVPLAAGADVELLVQRTEGYSGADLSGLVREAGMAAMREAGGEAETVQWRHLLQGLDAVKSSGSARLRYEEQ